MDQGQKPSNVSLKIFEQTGPSITPKGEVSCRAGLGLEALALRYPEIFSVEFDCRQADCGICLIRATGAAACLSPLTTPEREFLEAMGFAPSQGGQERLAFQARVLSDGEITLVPP